MKFFVALALSFASLAAQATPYECYNMVMTDPTIFVSIKASSTAMVTPHQLAITLCKGTTNPFQTIKCFQDTMRDLSFHAAERKANPSSAGVSTEIAAVSLCSAN